SPKKPKTAQEKPLLSAAGTICVTPLAPECWKKDLHSRLSLRSWVGVRAQRFVWRSGMVILAKPPSAKLWKPSALVRLMCRRCVTARSSSRKVGQTEVRTLPSIESKRLEEPRYALLLSDTVYYSEWSQYWARSQTKSRRANRKRHKRKGSSGRTRTYNPPVNS